MAIDSQQLSLLQSLLNNLVKVLDDEAQIPSADQLLTAGNVTKVNDTIADVLDAIDAIVVAV